MSARVRFWLLIAALILFGRIFQAHVLWAEEGLPLAVAQQILAGKTLYRDVWFDKPPLLAWFYVAVLRLAGYSGYGLRLFGVLYVLAIVITGFLLGKRLWGETEARWVGFFLAFFTAFYHHSATVPLAADLLLLLPHLAVFLFLVLKRPFVAGLCAGLAFHLNSKALFVLAAAASWVLFSGSARLLLRLMAGFLLSVLAGMAAVALSGGWSGYVEQVWRWGSAYARVAFSDNPWSLGSQRTFNYLGFHAALAIGAAWFFRNRRGKECRSVALWLAISFIAAATGQRFFPRYYFQVLPALALAAGAGWTTLGRRRAGMMLLAAALVTPVIRFGKANLLLAWGSTWDWRDTAMDADSRVAGERVARLSGPEDRIFVWGFRPEIYYYSRRAGVSRFLETQPLTGVLADRHLERSDPFLPEDALRLRAELVQELQQDPPAVVVDGLGPYNRALAIENYPELKPVLEHYRLSERTAGTVLYVRR